MSDSLGPFADSQYINGSQTPAGGPATAQTQSLTVSNNVVVSVEQKMYGTGKARRVITRGQIIRGRK